MLVTYYHSTLLVSWLISLPALPSAECYHHARKKKLRWQDSNFAKMRPHSTIATFQNALWIICNRSHQKTTVQLHSPSLLIHQKGNFRNSITSSIIVRLREIHKQDWSPFFPPQTYEFFGREEENQTKGIRQPPDNSADMN